MQTPATTGRVHRTLILASPFLPPGDDVRAVQRALKAVVPGAKGLAVDGEYGPATASAVAVWKRLHAGYPDKMLTNGRANGLGVEGQEYLRGVRKVPVDWLARAAARRGAAKKVVALGEKAHAYLGRFIGQTETPPGSNKVPAIIADARRLGVLPWIAAMGYPWCALFVWIGYLGGGQSRTAHAAIVKYLFNGLYCPEILNQALAGRHGMRVAGWSEIRRGDPLICNFPGGDPRADHIAVADRSPTGDVVATREGNTSSTNLGSQSNGGGAFDRTRTKSQVRAAIRVTNAY